MDSSELIASALSLSRSYSTPYRTTLGGGATIPPLPKVVEEISIDYDKSISSLQVLAAGIHETVGLDLLKFISSAVITLSGVVSNPTGSATHPTEKLVSRISESGEETLVFTDSSDGPYIEYNGYRIKRESIRPFHDADAIEVAAYIGNAVHALGKGLGNENFSAFLDNRFKTVEARLTTTRSIFVPNSQFVTRDFVKKCNMASVAFPHIVANLIHWICKRARNFGSAPSQAFANFVQLLEGHGLTNLTIIHEGIRVAPWLLQDIPELIGDLPAYVKAMEILQASDPDTQAYAKVIHQNRYVPIPADLKIAGAYWEILKLLKSTISKFQGVDIGDGMRIRVATAIKEHHFMEEPKFS